MKTDLALLLGSFALIFGLMALALIPFLRREPDDPVPEAKQSWVAPEPAPAAKPVTSTVATRAATKTAAPPPVQPVAVTPDAPDVPDVPSVPEPEPHLEAASAAASQPERPVVMPEADVYETPPEPPEEASFEDLLEGYALGRDLYWDALVGRVTPGAVSEASARYPIFPPGSKVALRRTDGQVVRGTLLDPDGEVVRLTDGIDTNEMALHELGFRDRMRLDPVYRTEAIHALAAEYLFHRLPDRCRAEAPPAGASLEDLAGAGAQGSIEAARRAGMQLLSDVGRDPDPARAFTWLLLAAKWGDEASQFHLGRLYYHGKGVERSEPLALAWMDRATQQGHEPARRFVEAHWLRRASYRRTAAEASAALEQQMQQEAVWLEEAARRPPVPL